MNDFNYDFISFTGKQIDVESYYYSLIKRGWIHLSLPVIVTPQVKHNKNQLVRKLIILGSSRRDGNTKKVRMDDEEKSIDVKKRICVTISGQFL